MKQDRELHSVQGINLRPIVSYPDVAQAGMSYLLSIDLELADLDAPWPYPQEEYEITFVLDLRPYFSYQPVSKHEPAIILHRFGGTYGPAEYLITTTEKAVDKGNINITFINGSGIPIASLDLPCEVRPEVPAASERDMIVWGGKPVPVIDREPAFAFAESAGSGDIASSEDIKEETSCDLISEQLAKTGWSVQTDWLPQTALALKLNELPAIAIYGYPGFEEDYVLFLKNVPVGIVKVHPIGETLSGTEDTAILAQRWLQLVSKTRGVRRQTPFVYDSTGYETQFTNYLEPDARSRTLFTFHRPETLASWLEQASANVPVSENDLLRSRLRRMPPLQREGLRDYQFEAIKAIEQSLAENHSHTLIRMETGTGKTHTAMHAIYRLLKYGGARRILYLIDFSMAQDYAMGAFLNFTPNDEDHKFTDLYKVSRLSSQLDPEAVVYVGTVEDLYVTHAYTLAFLNGVPHVSGGNPVEVNYNSTIPIEYFDVILLAECEHIDYQKWQPFLEYFDTIFIGISDSLSNIMLNFFKRNLVSDAIQINMTAQARLYYNQGQYAEAEPLMKQVLEINEYVRGPEHSETIISINNLARLYQVLGRYKETEPLLERVLFTQERVLDVGHPDVANSRSNLARLYQVLGKYSQAEPFFERALSSQEQILGAEHPDLANSLNNLAGLYQAQGKYQEAEALFERVLSLQEQILGAEHPDVASSLNNLAGLYQAQGKYQEAEALFERVLSLQEQILGAEHPDVASSLNNLAGLYQAQGRFIVAKPLYLRARTIQERAFGPKHPDLARTLGNLAALYNSQRNFTQAEPLILQAISIFEQALGPEHSNTIQTLRSYLSLLLNARRSRKAAEVQARIDAVAKKMNVENDDFYYA